METTIEAIENILEEITAGSEKVNNMISSFNRKWTVLKGYYVLKRA